MASTVEEPVNVDTLVRWSVTLLAACPVDA